MKYIIVLLVILPFTLAAQTRQDTLWMPFKSFAGKWIGESEGQPGKGTYERSYEFVMSNKFVEVRNKSTYAPSAEKPKGEVHEDHGFISYDKARKIFVLRQF